jgi:hypothetical protein
VTVQLVDWSSEEKMGRSTKTAFDSPENAIVDGHRAKFTTELRHQCIKPYKAELPVPRVTVTFDRI